MIKIGHIPVQWEMMKRLILVVGGLILLHSPQYLLAYSVLSHETLIDAAWETGILPVLRQNFPDATPEQMLQAHAFAYGGSLIQDLVYFPRGNHEYSDLVHCVRSGDFVMALIRDASSLDEYAFALGALAHYAADNEGHRIAVNKSVPILYPHLRGKFGNVVTYEDNPLAHVKTEFGFDVLEVAKHHFAPESYRRFIGFSISKDLLGRAFEETYSIPLSSKFPTLDSTIGSFRFSVCSLIPRIVNIAWSLKKKEIQQDLPGMTHKKFLFTLSRASYEKEWGKDYQGPGFGSKVFAFLIRPIPKFGPLRVMTLHTPTTQTEQMFEASFNSALENYQHSLGSLRERKLVLPNTNLDTGGSTAPGTYFMLDGAYARLLHQLTSQKDRTISPELQKAILAHFTGLTRLSNNKHDKMDRTKLDWARVPQDLLALKDAK